MTAKKPPYFDSTTIIALFVIVGCFVLLYMDKGGPPIKDMLVMVIGFYFGRHEVKKNGN